MKKNIQKAPIYVEYPKNYIDEQKRKKKKTFNSIQGDCNLIPLKSHNLNYTIKAPLNQNLFFSQRYLFLKKISYRMFHL